LLALGSFTLFAPLLAFADRIGAPRDLRLVDHRLGLGRRLLLDEGNEHPGVLAANAEHVRRLALLEDLVLDVGALLAERTQSPLYRFLYRTASEFLPTQRTHSFLLLTLRRPPTPFTYSSASP